MSHPGTRGTQKNRHSNKQRRSSTSPNYGAGFRRDSGYPRHRRSRSRSRSRSPLPSARHDSVASSIPEQAGSPRNSKTSLDPRTSSLTDASPIIADKGPRLPQSSTSFSTTPRPISPKSQQQQASSSINPTPSLPATALQADSPGLPFPSNRPPITIPWQPKAMRSSSPPPRPSLRTGQPAPHTKPPPPLFIRPLPTVPPALSAGMAPSTNVEQTPEEKRAMWEERTR
jgi:hypothetical protein